MARTVITSIAVLALLTNGASASDNTTASNNTATGSSTHSILGSGDGTVLQDPPPDNSTTALSDSDFDFDFQAPTLPLPEYPPYVNISSKHKLKTNASFPHTTWCDKLGTDVVSGGSEWIAVSGPYSSPGSELNNITHSCVHLFARGPWREVDRLSL